MIAHPGQDLPGCPLDSAFKDLTAGAFALWVLLMTLPRSELEAGQRSLSNLVGLSRRSVEHRLKELRNKGYIRLVYDGKRYRRKIVLVHRALISGPSLFVML